MPAVTTRSLTELNAAVTLARRARHSATCNCFLFRKDDEAFCSMDEWRWSRAVDRLIDTCRER